MSKLLNKINELDEKINVHEDLFSININLKELKEIGQEYCDTYDKRMKELETANSIIKDFDGGDYMRHCHSGSPLFTKKQLEYIKLVKESK
jgi:hypothetical protein